jgi:hypothetical protein
VGRAGNDPPDRDRTPGPRLPDLVSPATFFR